MRNPRLAHVDCLDPPSSVVCRPLAYTSGQLLEDPPKRPRSSKIVQREKRPSGWGARSASRFVVKLSDRDRAALASEKWSLDKSPQMRSENAPMFTISREAISSARACVRLHPSERTHRQAVPVVSPPRSSRTNDTTNPTASCTGCIAASIVASQRQNEPTASCAGRAASSTVTRRPQNEPNGKLCRLCNLKFPRGTIWVLGGSDRHQCEARLTQPGRRHESRRSRQRVAHRPPSARAGRFGWPCGRRPG